MIQQRGEDEEEGVDEAHISGWDQTFRKKTAPLTETGKHKERQNSARGDISLIFLGQSAERHLGAVVLLLSSLWRSGGALWEGDHRRQEGKRSHLGRERSIAEGHNI